MSDLPSAEHWWIALGEIWMIISLLFFIKYSLKLLYFFAGSGLVMMIFAGQFTAYKLFRSNFVYPSELQNF